MVAGDIADDPIMGIDIDSHIVKHIGHELTAEGFARFDDISKMNLPFPEKIKRMSEWRMAFFSMMSNEFIGEMISLDAVVEKAKKKFRENITRAQAKGEIRPEISPDLIWLVTEKFNDIGREGKWTAIFPDYGTFQDQLRTILFFGLLTTTDKASASNNES